EMVVSVGACSSLAMTQLIGNIASATEEPAKEQFGRALRHWARRKLKVTSDVPIKGKRAQHRFDFVASFKTGRKQPITLSILYPGSNPLAAAQRFGFKATDLESTPYGQWRRV